MFSGLYRFAYGEVRMLLITCNTIEKGYGMQPCRDAYPWFEVDQYGAWNVMFVVCLVEEDVLAVATFCGPVFEYSLLADAVFSTQPLPIDGTHFHRVRFEQTVLCIDWNRTLVAALS